jgi:hypothetical protein
MTDQTRTTPARSAEAAQEALDQLFGYYSAERPASYESPAYDEALPEAA